HAQVYAVTRDRNLPPASNRGKGERCHSTVPHTHRHSPRMAQHSASREAKHPDNHSQAHSPTRHLHLPRRNPHRDDTPTLPQLHDRAGETLARTVFFRRERNPAKKLEFYSSIRPLSPQRLDPQAPTQTGPCSRRLWTKLQRLAVSSASPPRRTAGRSARTSSAPRSTSA